MKQLRPIKTARDYKKALDEVSRLWDAKDGTPEAEQLEVLAILIEAYEREHHPILPPDPVDAIVFRMEQEGLSQVQLARRLEVSPSHLSEVLNRRRGISLTLIRALHRELDIPLESLLNSEADAA